MSATEHTTEPITPADTDRIRVWAPPSAPHATAEVTSGYRPTTYWQTRNVDDPIPEVGDFWDLAHAAPLPVPAAASAQPRQIYRRPRSQVSGASSTALALAIAAVPLSLVGIGAILGMLAIVLGGVGIRQVAKAPTEYHGNGRAITAIVLGTGSALVGTPILLLIMGLAALL
ncbi:DUF4190 domain-containing protein [Gordonia sp. CPCC 205515]|uniref:DUF4190 domain-containing protein n=1 Tax=Gordonia sp. CPCC 205515 TaxID=3140791 RepID=UPI003AF3F50F